MAFIKPTWQNNYGMWTVRGEFDLTTSGAILSVAGVPQVRGDNFSVSRTATGTYVVVVSNESFYEVLNRQAGLHKATPDAAWAAITAIATGPSDGSGATITIKTMDDNATPTAADQASGTVSFAVSFRKWKV
jgi:hypothetical protein